MNVGELRKALEGISDNTPVVFYDVEVNVFNIVDSVKVLQVCNSHKDDYGDYVDPSEDGRYESDTMYAVFAIGPP